MSQAVFKLSPDLKTYDLIANLFGLPFKETAQKRIDGTGCRNKEPFTKNETTTRDGDYATSIEIKGLPAPSSVSAVTGTKRMPLTLGGHQMEATVSWTLTPIR